MGTPLFSLSHTHKREIYFFKIALNIQQALMSTLDSECLNSEVLTEVKQRFDINPKILETIQKLSFLRKGLQHQRNMLSWIGRVGL